MKLLDIQVVFYEANFMKDIKEIRKDINVIDEEMAALFEKRMKLAKDIAQYKIANGLDIYDAKREEEIISHNLALIEDDSIKSYYINFIKSVMGESKKYQSVLFNGLKVAYSGVPGAFAYIAAKKMYPGSEYISYSNFESAYKACEDGDVDVVILPIENSFAGDVGVVMDLLFQGTLKINKMYDLEVVQNLIGLKGSRKEDIKTVISHPQALGQAQDYILKNGYQQIEFANTALAATEIKNRNDKSLAAIASKETAELYDLEILDSHINSSTYNSTRFASLSRISRMPDTNVKMGEHFILVYTVKNQAGALAETLNIIGAHGYNMRTVRSRPMKELMWNYFFFVEVEGNINTSDGADVLNELTTVCDRLKLVGTYYDFKDK